MVSFSILYSIFEYFGVVKIDLSPYFMIRYNSLRLLLLVLPVLAGAWGLRTPGVTRTEKEDMRCFVMTMKYPVYDKSGAWMGDLLNNPHRVFLYRDLTMYELPYGFASGVDDGQTPTVYETRYQYFVFHRDSSSGLLYELRYPDRIPHRNVDSMVQPLSGLAPADTSRNILWVAAHSPRVYRQRDQAAGSLLEIYRMEDPKHPADRDSIWLWYSDRYAMLPAKLFLKQDKDSVAGMRLVQIHVQGHFHDVPANAGQVVPDHGEFIWKIEETTFFNRDSAMIYFGKYQAYCDSTHRPSQKRG
jgi:hypothetical protein